MLGKPKSPVFTETLCTVQKGRPSLSRGSVRRIQEIQDAADGVPLRNPAPGIRLPSSLHARLRRAECRATGLRSCHRLLVSLILSKRFCRYAYASGGLVVSKDDEALFERPQKKFSGVGIKGG